MNLVFMDLFRVVGIVGVSVAAPTKGGPGRGRIWRSGKCLIGNWPFMVISRTTELLKLNMRSALAPEWQVLQCDPSRRSAFRRGQKLAAICDFGRISSAKQIWAGPILSGRTAIGLRDAFEME